MENSKYEEVKRKYPPKVINADASTRELKQKQEHKISRFRDPISQYETISPDLAGEYLKKNKCNRPIKDMTVRRFADEMSGGKWRLTHQGIAFDRRGNLIDGQHRLYALLAAGVTLRFLVTRDLPPEANDGLDQGVNRGMIDIMHYRGINITHLHVGITKWMSYKMGSKSSLYRMSRLDKIEFFLKHTEAITFAYTIFVKSNPVPRVRIAAMIAVWARAYYHVEDKGRLEFAAEVMLTGIGGENERWLINLRNYLLYLKSTSGEPTHREIYAKTQRALYGWLNQEPFNKQLHSSSKEFFPLPGEKVIEPEVAGTTSSQEVAEEV